VTTFVISDIAERKFNIEYELQPHSLMERVGSRFTHRVLDTGGGDDATINPEQFSKYSTALTPVIEEMMEGKGQGRWAIVPCAFFVDVSAGMSWIVDSSRYSSATSSKAL